LHRARGSTLLQQEARRVGRFSQTFHDECPGEIDLTHFQVCRERKTPQMSLRSRAELSLIESAAPTISGAE